jgi:Protein of unknown function (DUF3187)
VKARESLVDSPFAASAASLIAAFHAAANWRWPAPWLIALAAGLLGTPPAEARELYGLLRVRDLTTFGFPRLDMRPAYAMTLEPQSWMVEAEIGYQNTWALSPQLEDFLESIEPRGRRNLTPADVQTIDQLPGENYLSDTELVALDLTFHYQLSSIWNGYVTATGVSYQGGILDGLIEDYHTAFGFSNHGRPAVPRNQINFIYDLKHTQFTRLDASATTALTDPIVGLRYTGIRMPKKWRLIIEGAIKIPVRSRDPLFSTGRADYGGQISLQRLGSHQGFYLSGALVWYAGAPQPLPQQSQWIPTAVAGYERILTDRFNLILQVYTSPSVYTREQTDLHNLLADKFVASLGVRYRFEHVLLSFGFMENFQNLNNTPDIGFQLGLVYLPWRPR